MSALDEILSDLGITEGAVPVTAPARELLPSPLSVTECAVSSVAACLGAAAELMAARTGHRPEVSLDAAQVVAAVRSEVWLRDPTGEEIRGFAPLSRLWRTADGWARTHANYPWHRQALLDAFGVPDGDNAVVERVLGATFAGLAATEIEQRAYASGALAVAARNTEQWRSIPAGAAVDATSLVAIDELVGNAPPLGPSGPLPASGVRVLDLTRVIAGPTGTRMLGALGAEVLRIDPPGRPELPLHAVDGVIGKASAILDAATRRGKETVEELLAQADVVVSGYRPGALRRLGLEPDQLAECHPHLIVASLSAWGPGAWEARRGFDSLVQIASGIGSSTSTDGDRPGVLPCQLLDHATGYLLAAGVLAALARRARTGQVTHVRVSLARTAKWLLDQPALLGKARSPQTEAEVAPYRVALGNGWSAIGPPGRLDDRPLAWPHLPPHYGGAVPAWSDPAP